MYRDLTLILYFICLMNEAPIFPLRPGPQTGGLRIMRNEKGASLHVVDRLLNM